MRASRRWGVGAVVLFGADLAVLAFWPGDYDLRTLAICVPLLVGSLVAALVFDRLRDEYDRQHPIPGSDLQDGSGD